MYDEQKVSATCSLAKGQAFLVVAPKDNLTIVRQKSRVVCASTTWLLGVIIRPSHVLQRTARLYCRTTVVSGRAAQRVGKYSVELEQPPDADLSR